MYIVSGPISIELAKWGDKIIKETPVYISDFFLIFSVSSNFFCDRNYFCVLLGGSINMSNYSALLVMYQIR